jgi:hypothetical protein
LCNAANVTGKDIFVNECPPQCYICSDNTGQCHAEAIVNNLVEKITCTKDQLCSVRNEGNDTGIFIRGCEDRETCTKFNKGEPGCSSCCLGDLCNVDEPDICTPASAVTSQLSVLSLAIAGIVNFGLLAVECQFI